MRVEAIVPLALVSVTFTVNDLVEAAPFLSFALMVNVKVPAFVSVPVIFPVEALSLRPSGSFPLLTLQV